MRDIIIGGYAPMASRILGDVSLDLDNLYSLVECTLVKFQVVSVLSLLLEESVEVYSCELTVTPYLMPKYTSLETMSNLTPTQRRWLGILKKFPSTKVFHYCLIHLG
jgi:hypothetical protein